MMKFFILLTALLLVATASGQSTEPAEGRSIQTAMDGTIIATSAQRGVLHLMAPQAESGITIGLPDSLQSMDVLSVSDDNYLFILSVYTPALCTFLIETAIISPLPGGGTCIDGSSISVSRYTGLSALAGVVVVSGGTGGFTILDYDRNTGALNTQIRCLNCQVSEGLGDLSLDYVDVVLVNNRYAVMSVIADEITHLAVVVDINSANEVAATHTIPETGDIAAFAVTPQAYPCKNALFPANGGDVYIFTACGSISVKSMLDETSTVIIDPPIMDMVAIDVAIDLANFQMVLGGIVNEQSYLAIYTVDRISPVNVTVQVVAGVEGRLIGVSARGGQISYVTEDAAEIQVADLTVAPSSPPSIGPSMVPSMSLAPSASPSLNNTSTTAAPSSMPSTMPSGAGLSMTVLWSALLGVCGFVALLM